MLVALLPTLSRAQTPTTTYAIQGAKIFTLAGPPIENGTVLIRDGKIAQVGRDVSVPAGAKIIDGKGLEIYPGMFDPVTQIGIDEVSAVASTLDVAELGLYNPDLVAATAVNPTSAHIPVTRASGITEVLVVPGVVGFFGGGGSEVIGGQASAINLAGWTNEEMIIRRSVAMAINWPVMQTQAFDLATFTLRERPFKEVKEEYDKKVNGLGDLLEQARHYSQAMQKGPSGATERDLKLEALVPVVEGKLPVLVVANDARGIKNAVEFCRKNHLKMILAGGQEAYKVKDLLKQENIPVVLQPTERLPFHQDEPYDEADSEPSQLFAAGIKIAFASFNTSFSRRLPYYAGTAVGYGLPHEEALKAVTRNTAEIFGLGDQLGTIEPGKMANLIVTTGDPFELNTELKYLFINGQQTSMENKHHELYEEFRGRP
ncbi:MAG: amidohydrolase family protein [Candidatus Acidiferrales bacterium]